MISAVARVSMPNHISVYLLVFFRSNELTGHVTHATETGRTKTHWQHAKVALYATFVIGVVTATHRATMLVCCVFAHLNWTVKINYISKRCVGSFIGIQANMILGYLASGPGITRCGIQELNTIGCVCML